MRCMVLGMQAVCFSPGDFACFSLCCVAEVVLLLVEEKKIWEWDFISIGIPCQLAENFKTRAIRKKDQNQQQAATD